MKAPVIYRAMTGRERELAVALVRCRFPGACFSRRFAQTLKARAEQSGTISEAQAARLEVQAYIYRRQLPGHLVPSSPPPGYLTRREREAEARSAELRRRVAEGCAEAYVGLVKARHDFIDVPGRHDAPKLTVEAARGMMQSNFPELGL